MATMAQSNPNQPQDQQPQRPIVRSKPEEQQPLAREQHIRSPFGMMRSLMNDLDRLFSEFGRGTLLERAAVWAPDIELLEKEGKLVVRADLSGLKPEDVRVNVDDDVLTISGERKQETEEQREGAYVSERSYGSFMRRIQLPDGTDPDKIEARFENGVLEVTVPTPARSSRGKSIAVKSGGNGKK